MPRLRDSIVVDPQQKGRPSFFGFDIFITPLLLQLFFVVGCIASVWLGAVVFIVTWRGGPPQAWWEVVILEGFGSYGYHWAVGIALVGPLLCRVVCEFSIVLFKIFLELRGRAAR